MSARFTPGPWAYRPERHDDWGTVRAGRYFICQARDPEVWSEEQLAPYRQNKTDPWEANARLIAAAPDLYRELQAAGAIFRAYQALHLEKGTGDGNRKAEVNGRYADSIERTLASVDTGPQGEDPQGLSSSGSAVRDSGDAQNPLPDSTHGHL